MAAIFEASLAPPPLPRLPFPSRAHPSLPNGGVHVRHLVSMGTYCYSSLVCTALYHTRSQKNPCSLKGPPPLFSSKPDFSNPLLIVQVCQIKEFTPRGSTLTFQQFSNLIAQGVYARAYTVNVLLNTNVHKSMQDHHFEHILYKIPLSVGKIVWLKTTP